MPKKDNFSSYNISDYLFNELNQAENFGKDTSGVKSPKTVSRRTVNQNSRGEWNEIIAVDNNPYPGVNETADKKLKERDKIIKDYENAIEPYDRELYEYNQEINDKKSLIISLVNTAISAGCSHITPTSGINTTVVAPGAENIGGVVCGYGSTLYKDRAIVSIYPKLDNYGAENPFDPKDKKNITPSDFGKGFESSTKDNKGAAIEGYEYIPTNPLSHIFNSSTCVGYANQIISTAAEIQSLRKLRDANVDQINILKEDKNGEEVRRWGTRQSKNTVERRKKKLKKALKNIQSFVDDVALEGLGLYFDPAKDFSTTHVIENSTGLDKVTELVNLGGDGIVVTPSTAVLYDGSDGPSLWFNRFSTSQYIGIGKNYIGEANGIAAGDSSYALEVWFKLLDDSNLGTSPTANGANLVGVSSSFGYGMQIYKPSTVKINFGSRGNGSLDSNTSFSLDTWYHVVCTRESGVGSKIYVNGVLDNSADSSSLSIVSSVQEAQFGGATSTILKDFNGKIGVVRVYGKNLSQEEVLGNYNAHLDRFD